MTTRCLALWLILFGTDWTQAAQPGNDNAMPGVWIEAESSLGGDFALRQSRHCSGGALAHLRTAGEAIALPLTLDAAIERPRLYIRYTRGLPSPSRVRVSIGPANAKHPRDKEVTALVDLALPPNLARPPFMFRSFLLPKIEAGQHHLFIQTLQGDFNVEIDIVGVVDHPQGGRWIPPAEVRDGKFVGAGAIGPSVRVDSVDLAAPVQLIYGHEVLGDRGQPATLQVTLTNPAAEAVETSTSVEIGGEGGAISTTPGPKVKLAADETRVVPIEFKPSGYGWFTVTARAGDGGDADLGKIAVGVVRKPADGLRPGSIFGLNIGYSDQDLQAARMIGLKWRRGAPAPLEPMHVAPEPGKWWTDERIQPIRQAVRKWKDAGILTLGLVNYNTPWNVALGPEGKPVDRWRNRPADLNVQAEIEYRIFKGLREDVTFWEIWNEPWVAGWTWQTGTAKDYRDLSRLIWERTKPEMPEIMLIGGGSTSYQRDILFAPGNQDIGYADGCSTHPYNSPDRTMPSSAAVESILLKKYSKSGGSAGIWATEIGAPEYNFIAEPEATRPFTAARTVAPLYLLNLIGAGDTPIRVFYFTSDWGQRFSDGSHNMWDAADPKPSVVAFSAMTHFLEDGKLREDLLAASTAMWAPHLVKPDGSSVVAFWAEEGYSGKMRLPAGVFEAFDYLGRPTGTPSDAGLVVDFQRWGTVYLVSKKPPEEVKAAMATARFAGMESLRINPRSFTAPLAGRPPLRLKVQNLLPQTVDGEITVQTPAEIELAATKQSFKALKPGEIRFIEFAINKATPSAINRYRIDYTAVVGDQTQKGSQVVQAAYATFGTPTIDGNLEEWKDVTPVTMLSRGGKDFLEIALNPDKAAALMAEKAPAETAVYRVWTRWDDKHFHLAAEVSDAALTTKPSFGADPNVFPFTPDNLQIAFDCLERNPDDWFIDHPLREKCLGSEVDYEFAAASARDGPTGPAASELHRLKAPGTNYQTFYPGNIPTNPPLGLMSREEGSAAIVYDDKRQVIRYEIAIPWTSLKELGEQLKGLKGGESFTSRMAFGVTDDQRGKTFWTQEAGDLQSGAYGFSPTWSGGSTRCGGRILTDWGFVR